MNRLKEAIVISAFTAVLGFGIYYGILNQKAAGTPIKATVYSYSSGTATGRVGGSKAGVSYKASMKNPGIDVQARLDQYTAKSLYEPLSKKIVIGLEDRLSPSSALRVKMSQKPGLESTIVSASGNVANGIKLNASFVDQAISGKRAEKYNMNAKIALSGWISKFLGKKTLDIYFSGTPSAYPIFGARLA